MGNSANGITDLFAKTIHSDSVKTNQLCVGATCVTEAQLQQLLQNQSSQNGGGTPTSPVVPSLVTPPVTPTPTIPDPTPTITPDPTPVTPTVAPDPTPVAPVVTPPIASTPDPTSTPQAPAAPTPDAGTTTDGTSGN